MSVYIYYMYEDMSLIRRIPSEASNCSTGVDFLRDDEWEFLATFVKKVCSTTGMGIAVLVARKKKKVGICIPVRMSAYREQNTRE